ncbi:MAG: CDP-alcohol phosphatidyltransferase family protein [Woeseiaceae bacterium]|nr:CDP-alcohol phosphatidyltransferase family protein [Woeseiaceae bacterium]
MSLRWLPNAVSMLRIVLVLPILLLIDDRSFEPALLLFVIAACSDGIDGWLAKRFGWHTRLGALLDPIADKLLVAGMFVMLVYVGLLPTWLAVMVVSRDAVIVAGATAYNFLVGPVQGEPTRVSKLNTAFELLLLLFVMSRAALDWPSAVTVTVLGAAVMITVVISGIDYVWSWAQRARGREPQES